MRCTPPSAQHGHIGLRHLRAGLERSNANATLHREPELSLRLRHLPFFLYPDMPSQKGAPYHLPLQWLVWQSSAGTARCAPQPLRQAVAQLLSPSAVAVSSDAVPPDILLRPRWSACRGERLAAINYDASALRRLGTAAGVALNFEAVASNTMDSHRLMLHAEAEGRGGDLREARGWSRSMFL